MDSLAPVATLTTMDSTATELIPLNPHTSSPPSIGIIPSETVADEAAKFEYIRPEIMRMESDSAVVNGASGGTEVENGNDCSDATPCANSDAPFVLDESDKAVAQFFGISDDASVDAPNQGLHRREDLSDGRRSISPAVCEEGTKITTVHDNGQAMDATGAPTSCKASGVDGVASNVDKHNNATAVSVEGGAVTETVTADGGGVRSRTGSVQKAPDGWHDYSNFGEPLGKTRIIALKTPLTEDFDTRQSGPFTCADFVEAQKKLGRRVGLVVDLTNTTRYYDPKHFTDANVEYRKIMCVGHEIPSAKVVREFFDVIGEYMQRTPTEDSLVAVHCTHGVNRTGFLVCLYLVHKCGMTPADALSLFSESRPPGIQRQTYSEHILRRGDQQIPDRDAISSREKDAQKNTPSSTSASHAPDRRESNSSRRDRSPAADHLRSRSPRRRRSVSPGDRFRRDGHVRHEPYGRPSRGAMRGGGGSLRARDHRGPDRPADDRYRPDYARDRAYPPRRHSPPPLSHFDGDARRRDYHDGGMRGRDSRDLPRFGGDRGRERDYGPDWRHVPARGAPPPPYGPPAPHHNAYGAPPSLLHAPPPLAYQRPQVHGAHGAHGALGAYDDGRRSPPHHPASAYGMGPPPPRDLRDPRDIRDPREYGDSYLGRGPSSDYHALDHVRHVQQSAQPPPNGRAPATPNSGYGAPPMSTSGQGHAGQYGNGQYASAPYSVQPTGIAQSYPPTTATAYVNPSFAAAVSPPATQAQSLSLSLSSSFGTAYINPQFAQHLTAQSSPPPLLPTHQQQHQQHQQPHPASYGGTYPSAYASATQQYGQPQQHQQQQYRGY